MTLDLVSRMIIINIEIAEMTSGIQDDCKNIVTVISVIRSGIKDNRNEKAQISDEIQCDQNERSPFDL